MIYLDINPVAWKVTTVTCSLRVRNIWSVSFDQRKVETMPKISGGTLQWFTTFIAWFLPLVRFGQGVSVTADNNHLDSHAPFPSSTTSIPTELSTISEILERILEWKDGRQKHLKQDRPFVTLAFAQSVDGKIALYLDKSDKKKTSSNLPISGSESLLMTHGIRSIHDAILVGGRTLSIDNPRLSNRLWTFSTGSTNHASNLTHQPRPIILDTHLNHLRRIQRVGMKAKDVIVCCSYEAAASYRSGNDNKITDPTKTTTVTLLPCPKTSDGRLDLTYILKELQTNFEIHSVMVEGGGRILSMFMEYGLVDCICITIAPKLFGNDLGYSLPTTNVFTELEGPKSWNLGNDCTLLGKWPSKPT